jgi:hypothetical protein
VARNSVQILLVANTSPEPYRDGLAGSLSHECRYRRSLQDGNEGRCRSGTARLFAHTGRAAGMAYRESAKISRLKTDRPAAMIVFRRRACAHCALALFLINLSNGPTDACLCLLRLPQGGTMRSTPKRPPHWATLLAGRGFGVGLWRRQHRSDGRRGRRGAGGRRRGDRRDSGSPAGSRGRTRRSHGASCGRQHACPQGTDGQNCRIIFIAAPAALAHWTKCAKF